MKFVVISDLEGSMLDSKTRSAIGVLPAVEQLKMKDVPIVFCSSKTQSEQMHYLKLLGLRAPFISESGSALFIPENYFSTSLPRNGGNHYNMEGWDVIEFGARYDEVSGKLEKVICELNTNYQYFGNLSIKEIANYTSLSIPAAMRASERGYSETIFNVDTSTSAFEQFREKLDINDLKCDPGTQFITVTGKSSNIREAISFLIGLYKVDHPGVRMVGIGKHGKDEAMLSEVDLPYLIQNSYGEWADIQSIENLVKIKGEGPAGWKNVANLLMEQMEA